MTARCRTRKRTSRHSPTRPLALLESAGFLCLTAFVALMLVCLFLGRGDEGLAALSAGLVVAAGRMAWGRS